MTYDPTKTIAVNEADFDARLKVFEAKANGPTLMALLLSSTSATVGVAYSANITGATAGSTLTASGLPSGLTLNSAARTITGTPTAAGNNSVTLIETLSGATGSPKSSTVALTVAAAPSSSSEFTMTQLATPNRIYQRSSKTGGGASAGQGVIPVTLNVTKAGPIYARTRSTASGNPVLQSSYLAVSNAPAASGLIDIPGIDARVEDFFLDLSPDGTTWINGTVPVGMGKLIAYHGQSLMVAMFNRRTAGDSMASVGETPTTAGRILSEGGAWQGFTDSDAQGVVNGAGANVLIRLQAAQAGCRVGLVGYAAGATAIAYWTPGNEGWSKFMASINAAGKRFEALLWMQGHSDSSNFSVTSYYYRQQLSTIYAALDAAVTDTSFTRYICTIPNISTTSWGFETKKEAVRHAGERWCRENPRAVSVVMDDLKLMDGVHQDQAGSLATAVNFHRHMIDPTTAIGATIGKATLSGALLSVPLTLPTGATALSITGDLKTRLGVYYRSTRNPDQALAISSIELGAASGQVVPLNITMATAPDGRDLDIYFNPKNDPSQDGSAVVLRNNLTGNGASYGRQVTATKPARYAQARPATLNNSPAYSAGRWTGRQGLSTGAGGPGMVVGTWTEGYTVELWVKHNGATGTNVFLHCSGAYVAFSGDDLNFNGTTYAGKLPRDTWHHVAFTIDAGVLLLHVDGGVILGGGAPGSQFPPNADLGIRGFSSGGFRPAPNACTVSDVAVFSQCMYGPVAFAVPTGPYAGNEPYLDHLYTLDGNGLDSVIRS